MARKVGPSILSKGTERSVYEAIRRLELGNHSTQTIISAILRGEGDDGRPLIDTSDFFKLHGRGLDQVAHGSTRSGGSLTLSSTISATKGFIYLGELKTSAYDETQDFFGIGTPTPSARLHLHLATDGTTGQATFGTHFMDATVGAGTIFNSAAYKNGTGTDWAFVIGGTNPGGGAVGSVLWMNTMRTNSLRIAMGFYGTDHTVSYLHMQYGALDINPPYGSVNNNALHCGFNDHCGNQFMHHCLRFDIQAEGDNLSGSPVPGITVTNTNIACVGINSPSQQRTGLNANDQPVVVIGGGSWFASQYNITLRLTTGSNFSSYNIDGTFARREVFQIKDRGSLGSGSLTAFAIDYWGRLCVYNPGNGGLNYRIAGNAFNFEVNQDLTASTTTNVIAVQNINGFTDGTGKGTMTMMLGDGTAANGNVRWAGIASTNSGGFKVALDRLAINSKLTMICDGKLDTANTPDFIVPTALLHLHSIDTAKVSLNVDTTSSQATNILTVTNTTTSNLIFRIALGASTSFDALVGIGRSENGQYWNLRGGPSPTFEQSTGRVLLVLNNVTSYFTDSVETQEFRMGDSIGGNRRAAWVGHGGARLDRIAASFDYCVMTTEVTTAIPTKTAFVEHLRVHNGLTSGADNRGGILIDSERVGQTGGMLKIVSAATGNVPFLVDNKCFLLASTPIVAKTATYVITTSDSIINCTANTFTVTLPTAVGIDGRRFVIKNSGTGTITVATTSSQTIDGLTTQIVPSTAAMEVVSTGANWIII
jgi:hypothetical protein